MVKDTCSAEDCDKPVRTRGYCALHYDRLRRGKPISAPVRAPKTVAGSPEQRARETQMQRARRALPGAAEKHAAQARAYRQANPEKHLSAARAAYWANPQASADRCRRRRADPAVKARDDEKKRAWIAANQSVRTDIEQRRRARKAGAAAEKIVRTVVWRRDGGICYLCDEPASKRNWHLDHTIPLPTPTTTWVLRTPTATCASMMPTRECPARPTPTCSLLQVS
jgi:hypothetical protein